MSHPTRGPIPWMGIGSNASADGHRHGNARITNFAKEVSA